VLLAFFRSGTALAVSMVAPWLWLMRNKEISGYLTGYRQPGGGTLLDPFLTFTGTLGGWLLAQPPLDGSIYMDWWSFSGIMKVAGWVYWGFILTAALAAGLHLRKLPFATKSVIGACGLVIATYTSFSVYRFVYSELGPLDSRMMSGLYIPILLLVITSLDWAAQLAEATWSRRFSQVFVVLLVGLGVWHLRSTVQDASAFGREGRHWGSRGFTDTPLHEFVRSLPADVSLFSNEPQSLSAATFRWPIRNQYQSGEPTLIPCSRRYFVWFNQSFLPDGKPVGGTVVYEDSWGQVIDLDRCDTDIGRFWP
jgi:hypothetical protein